MLQQFDEAVNDLEKSIELAPDDYETHARLATVHLFQEDYTPGIDALSKAIDSYVPEESTDPKIYLQGYIQRGSAELMLGNQEETSEADRNRLMEAVIADSETVLNEFPDRFPESGIALFRKGLALRMQERFGEAIIALNAAIGTIRGKRAWLEETLSRRPPSLLRIPGLIFGSATLIPRKGNTAKPSKASGMQSQRMLPFLYPTSTADWPIYS